MNVLSVDNISKKYREEPLFEGVTFGIESDEKVGLIGINGSGKSTVLNIVAGIVEPDTGRVAVSRDRQVSYLPQNPQFHPDQTILDAVFAGGNKKMRILGDYEAACHALSEAGGDDHRRPRTARGTRLRNRRESASSCCRPRIRHQVLSGQDGTVDFAASRTPVGRATLLRGQYRARRCLRLC